MTVQSISHPKIVSGPVILLSDGSYFDLVNPDMTPVSIEVIAHALSNLCRFTGHTNKFYCVTPDTRILTRDFCWVNAGDLETGDWLWGFDDSAGGHRDWRRWRASQSKVYGLIERDLYEVVMEDGTVIKCSAEHPFLASAKQAGNQRWITATKLHDDLVDGKSRYLPKFIEPWHLDQSWGAGWLAGILDGEGSLASTASRGASINVAQNPGPVLDEIASQLAARGFSFSAAENKYSAVHHVTLRGGLAEQLRLLGSVRPIRLMEKMIDRLEGREFKRTRGLVRIKSIKPIGRGEVVALETSTHTYITEGFGSHNSVAQHSVLMSYHVEPGYEYDALMHDAVEAFIGDVAQPLKALLPDYQVVEERVSEYLSLQFNFTVPVPPPVKVADIRMLLTEKDQLLNSTDVWAVTAGHDPYDLKISQWIPSYAKLMFLKRYEQLRPT